MKDIPPFGTLTTEDYATLGFRAGLEIHRQLATKAKLFCRCPVNDYRRSFDARVSRRLWPAPPAYGLSDAAAAMELKTRREVVYRLARASCCGYELGETPPASLDEEALAYALRVALLFNCRVVGEVHFGRKPYWDGSAPAGFQRTALVGFNGFVPFNRGRLIIKHINLEEDTCRKLAVFGHNRVFLADRMGIPIVEVATAADLTTPAEVAEAAHAIHDALLATGVARAGAGAGRHDVNVSIAGGSRVEIKGVASLAGLALLTHN